MKLPLIVGAYQKGIRDFDVKHGFESHDPPANHTGCCNAGKWICRNKFFKSYMELGYVPTEEGQVSNTLNMPMTIGV